MLDILQEKPVEQIDYPEFLTGDRLDIIYRMFYGKRSRGKLKIGIGLQELKLTVKEKRVARNRSEMMALEFWKAPAFIPGLKNKVSYHTISCRHMLQPQRLSSFKDNWYRPFTNCLDEKSFTAINKGEIYLCLVKQVEEKFIKQGEIIRYRRGSKIGDEIILVKPEIVKVYPPDIERDTIKINYFELYEFLK